MFARRCVSAILLAFVSRLPRLFAQYTLHGIVQSMKKIAVSITVLVVIAVFAVFWKRQTLSPRNERTDNTVLPQMDVVMPGEHDLHLERLLLVAMGEKGKSAELSHIIRHDPFVQAGAFYSPTGETIIFKRDGDTYRILFTTQEVPSCDIVDGLGLPSDMAGGSICNDNSEAGFRKTK